MVIIIDSTVQNVLGLSPEFTGTAWINNILRPTTGSFENTAPFQWHTFDMWHACCKQGPRAHCVYQSTDVIMLPLKYILDVLTQH